MPTALYGSEPYGGLTPPSSEGLLTYTEYPRKAGRFGVGRVLYGTKFTHEFSPPAEDRPIWDFGRKVASFTTPFGKTPKRAFAKWTLM